MSRSSIQYEMRFMNQFVDDINRKSRYIPTDRYPSLG